MNRAAGVLKMHFQDKFGYLYLPWIILLSSFTVNIIVGILVNEEKGFYTGGLMSIYVYMFVMGIVVVAQSFPFALGFSVRRSDYYLGTVGLIVVLSGIFSALLTLFSWVEVLTNGWGVKLGFFHLPYLSSGSYVQQFLVYFLAMLFICLNGFVTGSYSKRFGKTGTFTLFIVLFLLGSLFSLAMSYYDGWADLFQWFVGKTALDLAVRSMPVSIIFAALSYLFLRRVTV
ncbi:hypothetical protein BVG16_10220 [Paenibacillus selenitireducens]|jgi:hypothetical protein|uniref:Uncharacterized protein n=1 Tax=Paenibacillus selenitireducens TaxID=1324314 RepID=A0A1T2XI07_9BACL|nr:hypothetical protein [Paenibacillus selenitireducens]OPA79438.1 hypothetical protein BVG16_10220 [Paenibacillus selenitireducens]